MAEGSSLTDALDDFERELISAALTQADGNVAEAARVLRTDRANLYRRMKRLGLAARGETVG
jgi:transcriptional regulator with GAF, ATPase, and Fis domain